MVFKDMRYLAVSGTLSALCQSHMGTQYLQGAGFPSSNENVALLSVMLVEIHLHEDLATPWDNFRLREMSLECVDHYPVLF